ncbi:hypothetical protein VCHA52P453_190027 [Vibrio chagasii]|nr:hypothetical protein VCHA39P226_180027 [Vibrio chagasii]CAH7035075.1 hypothetical protein VCHA52P453_190027 [Vibrio chagasii]
MFLLSLCFYQATICIDFNAPWCVDDSKAVTMTSNESPSSLCFLDLF